MNEETLYYNLGVKMAATALGRKPDDLVAISGFVGKIADTKDANYGSINKFVCKIAADAFDEAGRKNELEYHVMHKLSHTMEWFPIFDKYSDAAFAAFGKIAQEYEDKSKNEHNDVLVKNSHMLSKVVHFVGGAAPQAVSTLAGVGAMGGGLAGSLYWLLNRHSNEDEDKSEAIKAKIDYYNKVSDEIKRQLAEGKSTQPQDIEKKTKQVFDQQQPAAMF